VRGSERGERTRLPGGQRARLAGLHAQYAPSGHGVHVCEPAAAAYVPATQETQASDDVAPCAKLADPGGHGTQVEPAYGPYEPAGHPVH